MEFEKTEEGERAPEPEEEERDKRWFFWTTTPDSRKVRVEEMLRRGGNVHLKMWDPGMGDSGGYRTKSLGFPVRDEETEELIPSEVDRAKEEARAARRRWKNEGDPSVPDLRPTSVLETVYQWWEREGFPFPGKPNRADQVSEDTLQRDRRAAHCLMRVWGRDFALEDLSQRDVDNFLSLRTTGRVDAKGQRVPDPEERTEVGVGVAVESLNRLRRMCEWARKFPVGDGSGRTLLEENPFADLDLPSGNNGEPDRPLYFDDEVEALLEVAPRVTIGGGGRGKVKREDGDGVSYLRTLITLAWQSGRRISSIVALWWSDWDADRGKHGHLRWRAEEDKVNREWWTPVTARVRDTLEWHRREVAPGVGETPLFPAPRSSGHVGSGVTLGWLRRAEELTRETDDVMSVETVKGRGWHGFRRLWVTKRKHLPRSDVADTGGWTDPSTLDIYEQSDPETKQRVVDEGARKRITR